MMDTMRGAVLCGHGGTEVIEYREDLPRCEPNFGDVRLRIKAAALNRLDLFVRHGWPGLRLKFPHVICADGAGVVESLGPGVDQFAVGERVCVDPTIIPPNSTALDTGLENQSRIGILGEHHPGLASEYAVVPARNLLNMPNHISFAEAAAAGLVFVTAWHSLITRGHLRAGETVLIVGAGGGVNSASIQIAHLAGAQVIVVGSNDERCATAEKLGAHMTINRENAPDWSREVYSLTNKRGVDIVVDNVGAATLKQSIRAARIGGRILIVGGTSGYEYTLNLAQLFARHLSLIGSTMGPHQDYRQVMGLLFSGELKAVIGQILPLTEAKRAQELLEDFSVFGKIVLEL